MFALTSIAGEIVTADRDADDVWTVLVAAHLEVDGEWDRLRVDRHDPLGIRVPALRSLFEPPIPDDPLPASHVGSILFDRHQTVKSRDVLIYLATKLVRSPGYETTQVVLCLT